jgi:hypothetical protein
MKKSLLLITAVSALCAAAPAAAQYRSQTGLDTSFDARIAMLQTRLDAGIRDGTIDRREAMSLRQQLRTLARLEDRYAMNGLSNWERADLQQRIRALRMNVRVADNGSYDRFERGRWGDEAYGQWGDSRYQGRGGPDEDIDCQPRGSVGGFIDDLVGRDTCLRIGQRATGNLYAVPSDYRSQYRDGRGVYYRSDGRSIYEIDARTNTVIDIHRMPRD